MLTATDFLSDSERVGIYSIAPGEGNRALSIFRDRHSEELAYPGIFLGQKRPDDKERLVSAYYSEICKASTVKLIGEQNQVLDVSDKTQASQTASYGFEVISNNFFPVVFSFYLQESRQFDVLSQSRCELMISERYPHCW